MRPHAPSSQSDKKKQEVSPPVSLGVLLVTGLATGVIDQVLGQTIADGTDTSSCDHICKMQCNEQQHINSRQQRKLAYRARNRLLSILRDAQNLKNRVYSILLESHGHHHDDDDDDASSSTYTQRIKSFPWLPNKNCGSWYLPPDDVTTSTEVYFKSSDGHITSKYAFSLKRLNLPLIELLHQVNSCFLVDSSVRKILPDSFSRTIPIWCCVMNRIVQRYRNDADAESDEAQWDTSLYTPASIVSPEEYAEILALIDSRVELLYSSKAIVNPSWLVRTLNKPLRPMWIAEGQVQSYTNSLQLSSVDDSNYFTIICCNPSYYSEGSSSKNHIHWVNHSSSSNNNNDDTSSGYYYTPGAADDDSEWGRNLSPDLFWSNHEQLLAPNLTDDETDAKIDAIIQRERDNHLTCVVPNFMENADKIGNIDLWIGSYEAGKPPDCWLNFDCVLNVTETDYPDMYESMKEQQEQRQRKCFYLQLPVAQGKKDKTELERWMPIGLVFLIHHLQQKRRVLVYGNKGRDRAVAVVLALVVFVCPPTYPLKLKDGIHGLNINSMAQFDGEGDNILYIHSDLRLDLVNALLKENGRETFLQWMHTHKELQTSSPQEPFADKESLRIVLQLVTQYRENAEPTRSTMQKLNRFFMSSSMYRHNKSL